MKFFLDANLPYSTKDIFSRFGEVLHAKDVDLQAASDETIFSFAVKEKAILVTKDLDFGNPYIYPKESHYGLIILRAPFYFTAKQINAVFALFLSSTQTEELKGSIIVLGPGYQRIRK